MPVPPLRPSSPSVSIVVPGGAPALLAALPAVDEVIVVVGRDADTTTVMPRAGRVVRQTREGLGNALACGVAASTGDIVVTFPAEGAEDPAELNRYVRALIDGADVAQGFRPGPRFGERIVLWLMAALFGVRRDDPGFGVRAFWRDVAGAVGLPRVAGIEPLRGDGPEIEPLLTVRAKLNGLFVTEVPSAVPQRTLLLESVRALTGEYFARRRSTRESAAGSIVVMTGRGAAEAGVLGRTGTDAGLINPAGRARAAMAGHAGSDRPQAGAVPAVPRPYSADRRLGPRRHEGDTSAAAVPRPAGEARISRTLGDATTVRRPWRPNGRPGEVGDSRRRVQGRPNLRVINGEGDGSSPTGQLRAVRD